jgi:hypothetical protein
MLVPEGSPPHATEPSGTGGLTGTSMDPRDGARQPSSSATRPSPTGNRLGARGGRRCAWSPAGALAAGTAWPERMARERRRACGGQDP